jgi:hypothetical protein
VAFDPDPDRKIRLARPSRQPIAFCWAASYLRIGAEELSHCGLCVTVRANTLADAAVVERLTGSSDKLPPDTVGHGEYPSITKPNMAFQPAFGQGPMGWPLLGQMSLPLVS